MGNLIILRIIIILNHFERTSLNKILEKVFNFLLEHPSIDHEQNNALWIYGGKTSKTNHFKIKMTKKIQNTIMSRTRKFIL